MEFSCNVPSSSSQATRRFFRLGFRITAAIGLLIGIFAIFWEVTRGLSQYFLNVKVDVNTEFFYRYSLMLTRMSLTLIGVLNLKFVLGFTDFFWRVRATISVKFMPVHGIFNFTKIQNSKQNAKLPVHSASRARFHIVVSSIGISLDLVLLVYHSTSAIKS